MTSDNFCLNCICVPVCKYKAESTILHQCHLMKYHIKDLIADMPLNSLLHIHFMGINRKFVVEKTDLSNDSGMIVFIKDAELNGSYKGIVYD